MRDPEGLRGLSDLIMEVRRRADITTVVEIGSAAGESTFTFACSFPKVYAIDPWDYSDGKVVLVGSMGEPARPPGKDVEAMFDRVILFWDGAVVKVKGFSLEVEKTWNTPIDLLYIDGDHSYEGVAGDIDAWISHVVMGGFCAGHDYGDIRYPGVKRAVDEHFTNVMLFRDKSWMVEV